MRRLRAGNEILRGLYAATSVGPQRVRRYVNGLGDEPRGPGPIRRRRLSPVYLIHERRPRGPGEDTALRICFDLLRAVESHPDTGNEVGRVSDIPDVGSVVGGSRLAARGKMKDRADAASRGAAADDILHHVDHEPRFLGGEHRSALRQGRPEHVALLVLDAGDGDRRGPRAERGKRGISSDQFNRVDGRGSNVDGWIRWNGRR